MADLQDYYNTGEDAETHFYGVNWAGQTFTASGNYSATSVKVKVFRVGSPGTVTAHLRATSAGVPTGGDLASGTTNGNSFTTDTAGAWVEITFSVPYSVTASTVYAVILDASSGSGPNRGDWKRDSSSPSYTDGLYVYSTDSGSSWSDVVTHDHMFEVWGDAGTVYAEGTKTVTAAGVVSLSTEQLALTEGTLTVTAAASVSLDTESYKSNSTFPSARPSDYDGDLYWHESTGTWTSTRTQIVGAWVQSVVVVSEEGEIYFRSI